MNRLALASAACLLAMSASAHAATNLVTNPGFETGDFTGWTIGGAALDGYPASVLTYGSATPYPTGAYGEAVPAESAASGKYGAYFVSDYTDETLTQSLTLAGGKYNVGFSYYAPINGEQNSGDSLLVASLGSAYTTIDVGTLTAGKWYDFSTTLTLAPGTYTGGFQFFADSVPSNDIVIDNAFVTSAVPEPSTWIMLLAGVAMIGAALRFGRRRGVGALLAH